MSLRVPRCGRPSIEQQGKWLQRIGARLSYANVVATLALFVALGGVSYAALTLPRDSVGSPQLRNGAVTLSKLGFPLGMATGTRPGPVGIGTPAPVCGNVPGPRCSVPPLTPLMFASLALNLSRPAQVLLFASAALEQPGSAGGAPDSIDLGISTDESGVDGQQTGNLDAANSFSTTVRFQSVVTLAAGHHRVGLTATGYVSRPTYASGGQLVAIVMPAAP
jgi:hypothetical protein